MARLVETGDTACHAPERKATSSTPDRLHIAISTLGDPLRPGPTAPGEQPQWRRSCRTCRDDGGPAEFGRPTSITGNSSSIAPQAAGQPRPVGTGAFHPDPLERAERGEPLMQLTEPSGRRRERLDAEHPAIGVNRRGDVSVKVCVYPASDLTRLSGSPGALLRRGPLRTRRAAFTAPGSSKLRSIAGVQ